MCNLSSDPIVFKSMKDSAQGEQLQEQDKLGGNEAH